VRLRPVLARGPLLAGGGLLAAAALHVAWGRGSAFPAPDRATLAEAVIGAPPPAAHDQGPGVPGAVACYSVAGALTVAAVGINAKGPIRRLIALGVVTALGARGAVGLAGLMPQEAGSPTFRRWNRLLYSPLCLLLAALTLPAVVSD
jgi:hypothetical protein